MEILTRDEFWAKKPAPGTKFLEIEDSACEVVAHPIDPDTDEPDDITMIGISLKSAPVATDKVIVLEWGSWDGHEHLLAQHDAAVASVERGGYKHECMLGISAKKVVKKTTGPKPRDPRKK